jgi:hypothetical protein
MTYMHDLPANLYVCAHVCRESLQSNWLNVIVWFEYIYMIPYVK